MLYYGKLPGGNFGDDLNPWLWSRLAPEVCDPQDPTLFVGIGTTLSHHIPAEPVKVVFGAGCGYSNRPHPDHKWNFWCVRGPLTAAALGLDPSLALTDPAILVRRMAGPARRKCWKVSFMPHHASMEQADWKSLCLQADLHCIDPRKPVEEVMAEIQQTDLIVTEAMHGAIVADALRVPWIPARLYSPFLEFKWRDWTQSLQLPLNLIDLPPVFQNTLPWRESLLHGFKKGVAKTGLGKEKWHRLQLRISTSRETDKTLRALAKVPEAVAPCLSADRTLESLEARLAERLAGLRAAWREGRFRASLNPDPACAGP